MRLRPLDPEGFSRNVKGHGQRVLPLSHSGAAGETTLLMCLGSRTRHDFDASVVPGADQSSTWFRVLLGESWT